MSPFIDARTKAKITIVNGDIKAELLKHIDIEQLPFEYGGQYECNGKGKPCIPEFDLKTLNLKDMGVASAGETDQTSIASGKTFSQKFEASAKGGTVHWFFRVAEDYNVSFSVKVEFPDSKKAAVWAKAACKLVADQGSYEVKEKATITVTFDNSFSWFRAKTLKYSCVIIQNDEKPPVMDTAPPPDMALVTRVGKDDDTPSASSTSPAAASPTPSTSSSSPAASSPTKT